MERKVTVYAVLYHVADDHPQALGGSAGDGSFIFRTRNKAQAERFAAQNSYYGKPATVQVDSVSTRLAQRWGVA